MRRGCRGRRCTGTFPAAATSCSPQWWGGSSPASSSVSTPRSPTPTRLEEVMERGLMFAHHALRRARGAPAGPGHRARHPPAPAVHGGGSDPHAGGAVPGARTWCATAWPKAPTSTRQPISWPAWCSPTSAHRAAGISTTRNRWRCSSGPSFWPASGERPPSCSRNQRHRPAVLPPPREGGVGALRALQPPDLHRLHDRGAESGWQCPECIAEGAKRSRQVPAFTHTSRNRTGVVGSTNPTPVVLVDHRHQRGGVLPRRLRDQQPRHRPLRPVARRGALAAPVLPGLHGHVAARQLHSTSSST